MTTAQSNERCKIKGPGLRFGKLYFLVNISLSHFLSNRFLLAKLRWRGYSYSGAALGISLPSYCLSERTTKMHPWGCVVSTSFYSKYRTAGGESTEEAAFVGLFICNCILRGMYTDFLPVSGSDQLVAASTKHSSGGKLSYWNVGWTCSAIVFLAVKEHQKA